MANIRIPSIYAIDDGEARNDVITLLALASELKRGVETDVNLPFTTMGDTQPPVFPMTTEGMREGASSGWIPHST